VPAVKTTESILSALTTGWLSHQSDIYGRKRLLVVSVFGALFMCGALHPAQSHHQLT
jgi:hypothetical protein